MSFPKPENDQELEAMLTETFGPPPRDDIDAWRKRYPSALAWLNPQRISFLSQRRKRMQRITLLAATTAAAIGVWFGLSHFDPSSSGDSAFAEVLSQIEHAQTVTWKSTDYSHAIGRDGKTTWLIAVTDSNAYQSPGLFRYMHENGVLIEDRVRGRSISLHPEKKQATIIERPPLAMGQPCGGPFQQFQEILKDGTLQWLERRTLPNGDIVNVFRNTEWDEDNKCCRSQDFWIDAKSKRLVKINFSGPGGELYDLEKDPIRNNPAGKDASGWHLMGCEWHDIVFDAKVDESLFSLKPPEGYTVKHEDRRLKEQDMLEYLGAFVEFHDRVFPDQAFPAHYKLDKLNAALAKPVRQQTAIEKKYLTLFEHYHTFRLTTPFDFFKVSDDVADNSFRYVGKGVKLGDKDRIVCWYKLKDTSTYRVIYGDLSVKDVAAKDLPLPVEP